MLFRRVSGPKRILFSGEVIEIEYEHNFRNDWKKLVRAWGLAAFLVMILSISIPFPFPGVHYLSASGSESLGTNTPYYSALYNTYVYWSETLYASSVSNYLTHISFESASLGSSSNPAWTFGVGVSGDNLTITQITSSFIEFDAWPSLSSLANIYFYYAGAVPSEVIVGNVTISASGFLTNSSCTAPCVLLNQNSGYIEILDTQASAMNLVYPGAQPTTSTTSTVSSQSSSAPPPPVTTTVTTTAITTTFVSTTQSSVTTVSTTNNPPPVITTSTAQTKTITLTTASTTSSTTTIETTSSVLTSATLDHASSSSSTSSSTSITNSSQSSSSSTSSVSTSETSATSYTFTKTTRAPAVSPFASMVVAIDSIPFSKSATIVSQTSMITSLTLLATIAPFGVRRLANAHDKTESLLKRVQRDHLRPWRKRLESLYGQALDFVSGR
jgi:hypothetical protein